MQNFIMSFARCPVLNAAAPLASSSQHVSTRALLPRSQFRPARPQLSKVLSRSVHARGFRRGTVPSPSRLASSDARAPASHSPPYEARPALQSMLHLYFDHFISSNPMMDPARPILAVVCLPRPRERLSAHRSLPADSHPNPWLL